MYEENLRIFKDTLETGSPATPQVGEAEPDREWAVTAPLGNQVDVSISTSGYNLSSSLSLHVGDGGVGESSLLLDSSHAGMLLFSRS